MRRALFILLIVALVAFGAYRWQRLNSQQRAAASGGGKYTPALGPRIDPKDVQVLTALDAEYTHLVNAVVPSVVSVNSSRGKRTSLDPLEMLFGQRHAEAASGSGVIVSREGHILTNNHVIAGMDTIEVQLADGRSFLAQLIGADEITDIAILKIDAPNLEPLALGDSDRVTVGQMVFAIGNPFGLQATVTQGIISAKGRRVMADSGVEFLQTDAAVNKGNSGGPLLNLRGEIIGINSSIYANTPEQNWLGISFAIPSNVARHALESVLKFGRIVRGYLGVTMLGITPELAARLKLPDTTGALVVDVLPGSPAEGAGVKRGDVIRRIDGQPMADIPALRGRIAAAAMNTQVHLTILRDGREQALTATITEAPGPVR
jgi:S1-C subfamily serine protease